MEIALLAGDPHLRQGTAARAVDGGAGVLAGATGRIVSNFLLPDTGDLTDHQLGVVFLRDEAESGPDSGDRREAL
jgi:hypothetical protein